MDDNDFFAKAGALLSGASEQQRAHLADMAQNYGKPKAEVEDQRRQAQDAAARKGLHERFPNLNRLRGA